MLLATERGRGPRGKEPRCNIHTHRDRARCLPRPRPRRLSPSPSPSPTPGLGWAGLHHAALHACCTGKAAWSNNQTASSGWSCVSVYLVLGFPQPLHFLGASSLFKSYRIKSNLLPFSLFMFFVFYLIFSNHPIPTLHLLHLPAFDLWFHLIPYQYLTSPHTPLTDSSFISPHHLTTPHSASFLSPCASSAVFGRPRVSGIVGIGQAWGTLFFSIDYAAKQHSAHTYGRVN